MRCSSTLRPRKRNQQRRDTSETHRSAVWEDAQKTVAITNGQTFAISDLNEGTGLAQRDLYVEGVKASGGLRDVVFTLQYPADDRITEDVVKFTVYEVGLKSVTFGGLAEGDFHPVYVDATGAAYGTTQWEDSSEPLNGNSTDAGDKQYPVCYVKGKRLLVGATFLATPREAFNDATISGDGPGDVDFAQTVATWVQVDDKWYAGAAFPSQGTLPSDIVSYYNPLAISWTLSSSGPLHGATAQSENEVFVTLAAPQCEKLYRTVAYLACHNGGATTEGQALANTWDLFKDPSGVEGEDVCEWNEQTREYRPTALLLEGRKHTRGHDSRASD